VVESVVGIVVVVVVVVVEDPLVVLDAAASPADMAIMAEASSSLFIIISLGVWNVPSIA
jgi:hypothetical protein